MSLFQTPLLSVINHPADAAHYTRGRGGFQPAFIVLHHTGGTDSLKWLSSISSPAVSCHRLIDKIGHIYKIVADEDTAYCAGYGLIGPIDPDASDPTGVVRNLNFASLNIELENLGNGQDRYTPTQMQACAAQIYEWWGKYGFLPILYHSQVDPAKHDPRGLDRPDLDRRLLALLRGVSVDSAVLRNLEKAAGHIQTGLGDIAAALAALK